MATVETVKVKTSGLQFSERELEKLRNRIHDDRAGAMSAHGERLSRWSLYMKQWRANYEAPAPGQEQDSNYKVPMTEWTTYAKWSRLMQALLGDDAEVVAEGSGPTDKGTAAKVGKFMTVRALRTMPDAFARYAEWVFKAVFYGRAFAYRPWHVEKDEGGEICYQGQVLLPLEPEDIVVPAEENVRSVQDFSWAQRSYWLQPDEFLEEVEKGSFDLPGCGDEEARRELVLRILRGALDGAERSRESDPSQLEEIREEQAKGEGVDYADEAMDAQGSQRIRVIECYVYWRMLRDPESDAAEDDLEGREWKRERLIVQWVPAAQAIVGVRRLKDVYERMRAAIPISELAVSCDGSYWPKGLGQQCYETTEEMTALHNRLTDAVDLTMFPPILYEPASGYDPKNATFEYGPKRFWPVTDPSGVKAMDVDVDIQGATALAQSLKGYAELATGISPPNMGASLDRPNAPKTAAGQAMLLEQGDIRGWLDLGFLRAGFAKFLTEVWELHVSFMKDGGRLFFRVTEEEANGLFEVSRGGANMEAEEFAGRFDFSIKFATSGISREARKAQAIELYQLDLQNPLIVQNPRALWVATNRTHKALGDDDFENMVPPPPELDAPRRPKEEHARMQQGELITVHPNDNDKLHLVEHYRAYTREAQAQNPDRGYLAAIEAHMQEQVEQHQTKMLMQQLTEQLGATLDANAANQAGGGLMPKTALPMENLGALIQQLTGGTNGQGQGPVEQSGVGGRDGHQQQFGTPSGGAGGGVLAGPVAGGAGGGNAVAGIPEGLDGGDLAGPGSSVAP